MFGIIIQRCFHVSKATMNVAKTSILAKLRKSTGYPLSNCKKALELHPDDFTKAEEWLHAEAKTKGWSKWAKIQTRTATQGLIGVCSRNNVGVMVEINCETDFVSKNAEFQQVVGKMLSGCMNYATNLKLEDVVTKAVLEESQLSTIQCETSTLGELLFAATCKFNEKTVAKRAICLKVPEDILLSSLSHPAVLCPNLHGASLGKYGVLLVSKESGCNFALDMAEVNLNICQHIIGMNPLTIGELTDEDIDKFFNKTTSSKDSEKAENIQCESNAENVQSEQNVENVHSKKNVENAQSEQNVENVHSKQNVENAQSEQNVENVQSEENVENVQSEQNVQSEDIEDSDDSEGQMAVASELKETNETELLFQPYLMSPDTTVGETLYMSGVEVLAFERFECGETVEEPQDVPASANA